MLLRARGSSHRLFSFFLALHIDIHTIRFLPLSGVRSDAYTLVVVIVDGDQTTRLVVSKD